MKNVSKLLAKYQEHNFELFEDTPYFIGAGHQETITYLTHSIHKNSDSIKWHIIDFSKEEFTLPIIFPHHPTPH